MHRRNVDRMLWIAVIILIVVGFAASPVNHRLP